MNVLPFNNLDEQLARFHAAKKNAKSSSTTSVNKKFTFKRSLSLGKVVEGQKTNTTTKFPCNNDFENERSPYCPNPEPDFLSKVVSKSTEQHNLSNPSEKYKKNIGNIRPDIRNYFSFGGSNKIEDTNDFLVIEKSRVQDLKPTKVSRLFPIVSTEVKENIIPKSCTIEAENVHEPDIVKKNFTSKFQDEEIIEKPVPEFQDKNEGKKYSATFLQETNIQLMTKICNILETRDDILQKHADISNLIKLRKKILNGQTMGSNKATDASDCSDLKKIIQQSTTTANESHLPNNSLKFQNCSDTSLIIEDDEDFVVNWDSKKVGSPFFKSSALSGKSSTSSPIQESSYKNGSFQASHSKSTPPLSNVSPHFKESPILSSSITKDNSFKKQSKLQEESVFILDENDTVDNIEEDIITIEDEPGTSYEVRRHGDSMDNSHSSKEKIIAGKFYGTQKDDGATPQYKGFQFPFSNDVMQTFQNVFGLKQFRHNQLEAINASLLGEDCFVLMPTGGGKSLCYQLPALVSSGVTIVVSPLRSLIMDQVQKLCSLDIPASSLTGDADASSVNQVYTQLSAREPGIKLLYVTPEKISASVKLISTLESLYSRSMIQRFVIDEAHCVSQWGHDFRPDYKRLKMLREKFPNVPLMALTATATQRVRGDILHQLGMTSPKWFLQSFNRPNLKYEVRPKTKSIVAEIIELLQSRFKNMCGIIYCLSRNDCDNVATVLQKSGIKAASYHAGINNRDEIQEQWINDRFKVIVATIAFGMGIDKPDVRFVIHHAIPKSIEGYYQESGRAGRDGEKSWCILFYAYKDMQRIRRMVMQDDSNRHSWSTHFDNLFKMVHYCENRTDCRRVWMLGYFGEIFDKTLCLSNPDTSCDNCYSKEVFIDCDVTEDAKAIVQCVAKLVDKRRRQNYTLTYFVDIYKGAKLQKLLSAGHDKLELFGKGQSLRRSDAERLLRKLVLDQYLQEDMIINQMDLPITYIYLGKRAKELLTGRAKVVLPFQESKGKHPQKAPTVVEDKEIRELTEKCYNELIEVSKAIALERHLHYTNVINVEALRQMSREMPMTEEDIRSIPHVTSAIYEKYGKQFLEVTQRYAAVRCVIDAERADKDVLSACVEDIDDWSDTDTGPSKPYARKGVKRKASKGAGSKTAKKQKNFFAKKKFQRGKGKGGYSTYASSKKRMMSSQNKAPLRTPGFMPNPKNVGKVVQRSFLPTPKVVLA